MKRDWPFTIFAIICLAAVMSLATYSVWQDRELNENFDDYSVKETLPVADRYWPERTWELTAKPCGESHAVPITPNEGVLIAAVASSHMEVCDVETGKPLPPSP